MCVSGVCYASASVVRSRVAARCSVVLAGVVICNGLQEIRVLAKMPCCEHMHPRVVQSVCALA